MLVGPVPFVLGEPVAGILRFPLLHDPVPRHLGADRQAFADLELRDGLLGAGLDRLLSGNGGEIVDGLYDLLAVGRGFAGADVQDDLVDLRNLHDVRIAELLHQALLDLFIVSLLKARNVAGLAGMLAHRHLGAGIDFTALGGLVGLRLSLLGFLGVLAVGACVRHRSLLPTSWRSGPCCRRPSS